MPRRFPVVSLATVVALLLSLAAPIAQGGGGRGAPAGQAPGGGGGRGAAGGRGLGPARDATTETTLGTGAISGVVVVDGTGTPVRRARVSLSAAELRGGRSVLTDERGRFTFTTLPAGRFTMTASKPGFVDNTYGAKRAGRPGTQIQLADGQKLDRAVIALPRGGVITGIVVDEHGEPSAGTQVRALRYVIRTGERTLQQAGQDTTDDRGMYRIYQLQPGEYMVNALPRNMTASDIRQTMVSEMTSLVQQLQGAGAGGRGAPVDAATIQGLANAAAGRGGQLGARLVELQQQLAATDQEQSTAYAPVFYPGTTVASSASSVTIGAGEERANVDFQLQLVPTSRVGGLVVSPDGALPQGTQVALVPADRGAMPNIPGIGNAVTRVGPDGRFTFNNVTPGSYLIQARGTIRQPVEAATVAPGPGGGGRGGLQGAIAQVLWASAPVDVGAQNPPDTVLNLQPGMTVSGRVSFDAGGVGQAASPDPARVRVSLTPRGTQTFEMGGGVPPAQVDASGRFTITGVPPGRYAVTANIVNAGGGGRGTGPAGTAPALPGAARGAGGGQQATGQWLLKSAVADGRDLLDFPVDIGPNQGISNLTLTFTDRTQELSGTIQDVAGRPTSDFTIIVFTPDTRYWLPQARRIASTRPGTDGRFVFRGLPPGDYRITAVTDVEPGEWYDPAFLTQLNAVSIPVAVAEGEKKVQDIRLAGGQ